MRGPGARRRRPGPRPARRRNRPMPPPRPPRSAAGSSIRPAPARVARVAWSASPSPSARRGRSHPSPSPAPRATPRLTPRRGRSCIRRISRRRPAAPCASPQASTMPPADGAAGLKALVLGSGGGGGVPKWNCRCPVCALAWAGDSRVKPRTQSSLAVSADGESWLLLNASIDLRQQILATPALQPKREGRHSPIAAVLLTNADVDHAAGLLALRERQPFTLWGTRSTLDIIGANRIFDVVAHDIVPRRSVELGEPFEPLPGL